MRVEQENTAENYAKLDRLHKSSTREITYLEKQLTKKSEEYTHLTKTFEEFLKLRGKNFQVERTHKTLSTSKTKEVVVDSASRKSQHVDEHLKLLELEKGQDYLKKFKALSHAYKTGSFKLANYKHNKSTELEEIVLISDHLTLSLDTFIRDIE